MGQVDQSGIIRAVRAYNVPDAYATMIHAMRDVWQAPREDSRNGPVRVARNVHLEIVNPEERVLFDPVRNANPFFHVMEFVWMMSGSNNVRWIERFNKRMREYADPGTDTHHGAYGHRWRCWFDRDQLIAVRDLLARSPDTRRAVLAMWDARADLEHHNDLPCNTHIYLAIEDGRLNFTVCNRSNDLIWGMLGANAVHMSLLQELLACSLSLEVGSYRVYTNNLHVYESLPNFEQIYYGTTEVYDNYRHVEWKQPVLERGESFTGFLHDCEAFLRDDDFSSQWLSEVAAPLHDAYMDRLNGGDGRSYVSKVLSDDWRMAAIQWIERKELAKKAR